MDVFLSPEARAEALRRLSGVAADEGVRILCAVESGSRAWGFPSPDSDYDVRFLYVRPVEDYLALARPRDVIERPIDGLWDVNGWDLGKSLLLLRKGNAVVVEWLRSPLVYCEDGEAAPAMRRLAEQFSDVPSSVRHYFGLLRGQWTRDFGARPTVRLKKYFYAIRSACALAWLRDRATPPPMALPDLLAGGVAPATVMREIEPLLAAKLASHEVGEGPRIAALDAFAEEMMVWTLSSGALRPSRPSEELIRETDALFRRAVFGG
jgi:predicted nucleotidyltransferase